MNCQVWRIVITAIFSCALGVNYTLYMWLDFDVLGITNGMLSSALQAWGYTVLLLGVLLLITLILSKVIYIKIIDKQLEIVMLLLFVLQLPMISLWFMTLFMQGRAALFGVILHHLLLGFAIYSFWKHQSYTKQQTTQQVNNFTIEQ